MLDIFNQIFTWLYSILPHSPFRGFIEALGEIPYLRYANWVLPISEAIVILEAWGAVIAIYYIYQHLLRAAGMIQ